MQIRAFRRRNSAQFGAISASRRMQRSPAQSDPAHFQRNPRIQRIFHRIRRTQRMAMMWSLCPRALYPSSVVFHPMASIVTMLTLLACMFRLTSFSTVFLSDFDLYLGWQG